MNGLRMRKQRLLRLEINDWLSQKNSSARAYASTLRKMLADAERFRRWLFFPTVRFPSKVAKENGGSAAHHTSATRAWRFQTTFPLDGAR